VKNIDTKHDDQQPTGFTSLQRVCLRQIHELLFSLNVALGVVLAVVYGYDGVFVPFLRLEDIIYDQMGLKGYGRVTSAHLALFLCVMALTALLLIPMRCLRGTSVMRDMLVSVPGFLALGVTPACWFYINHRYGWSWYPVETAVYFLLALLYLFQKWTIPWSVTILIVCIHYGFWYLRFSEYPHGPAELLAPIVGFCACLVWGIYVPTARARVGWTAPS
jgi:hypothetical protein